MQSLGPAAPDNTPDLLTWVGYHYAISVASEVGPDVVPTLYDWVTHIANAVDAHTAAVASLREELVAAGVLAPLPAPPGEVEPGAA